MGNSTPSYATYGFFGFDLLLLDLEGGAGAGAGTLTLEGGIGGTGAGIGGSNGHFSGVIGVSSIGECSKFAFWSSCKSCDIIYMVIP